MVDKPGGGGWANLEVSQSTVANWQAETQKGLPVPRCQVKASHVKAAWEREAMLTACCMGLGGLLWFAQPGASLHRSVPLGSAQSEPSLRVIFNYVIY